MAEDKQTPFVSGARVAVDGSRYGGPEEYWEAFIDRVYKNGNFTLRGDMTKQQWRVLGSGDRAIETGDGYGRRYLRLWTAEVDAEIRESIQVAKRRNRWRSIIDRIRRIRDDAVTDAMCDAIEAALPKPEANL